MRMGWRGLRGDGLVAAVALLCYANTLPNGYVYDSIEIVERNPMVHESGKWLDLWTVDHWFQEEGLTANRDLLYRPVALASYRLVSALAGPGPLPQHLVNVLLHAVISVLVVRLTRQLGWGESTALVAGVLFAVLPIHSEVVNDVVGRTDLIATLGVLLALSVHRRLIDADVAGKKVLWAVLGSLSVFCALGAKESAVCVLALVPLFDVWWHRSPTCGTGLQPVDPANRKGLSPGSVRGRVRGSLPTAARLSYLAIPATAYFALRFHALGGQLYQRPAATKTINVLVDAPPWQHVLGVVQAWGMYWRKTFWPDVLCPDYSMNTVRLATNLWEFDVLIGIGVAVALIVASIVAWRRGSRAVALCVVALALCFAPTSNAVALIQVFFAERIWYLPSVWVAILLAAGVVLLFRISDFGSRIVQSDTHNPQSASSAAWLVAIVALSLAMFGRCWIRNPEWKTNATVAAAAYRDHPDSVATLVMYGNLLATSGNLEAGIRLLNRAVEIDPGLTVAHRALGQAYLHARNDQRSLQHWRIAEMQFPGHPDTLRALRMLAERLTPQVQLELSNLEQAVRAHPQSLEAELAYVRKLLELARHDEALTRFAAAEKRFAHHAAWQQQYGTTLLFAGDKEAALQRYRNAVRLAPAELSPYVDLAALLMDRQEGGDLVEAGALLGRAQTLSPAEPNVAVLRAELLALQGDLFGALAIYRDLLHSLPADHPQRRKWETRAKVLGGR